METCYETIGSLMSGRWKVQSVPAVKQKREFWPEAINTGLNILVIEGTLHSSLELKTPKICEMMSHFKRQSEAGRAGREAELPERAAQRGKEKEWRGGWGRGGDKRVGREPGALSAFTLSTVD